MFYNFFFFFFNDTATTEIYTLSLHDALPICTTPTKMNSGDSQDRSVPAWRCNARSEEHTSELQSRPHLVCRLLLEKKKNNNGPYLDFCSQPMSFRAELLILIRSFFWNLLHLS